MSAFVVDTNVAVVANGKSVQAGPDCVIVCIETLTAIHDHGMIVLDDAGLILEEYMNHLSLSGQPGAGDLFMKWVFDNQAVAERCEQAHITPRQADPLDFDEFPDDSDLSAFDRSDRKFVAVALASQNAPEVLNAVDSDWADHHAALVRNNVNVRFLCPQHCAPVEVDDGDH